MTILRAATITSLSFVCVVHAGAAPGDPVITIRNGTVSIPYPAARVRVGVGGPGLDLSGLFDEGAFVAEACRPCSASSVISLGGSLSGTALGPQYILASNFTFAGDDMHVPEDGRPDVTLTARFTLEGQVRLARVREPSPDDTTLRATVLGSGIATVHLSSALDPETGQRLYFFQDLTYEFSNAPAQ